jgi:2,4-dienoyl-CoA reductase-like NADH-dependent reductase (Old Yellow Enzyme family)
VFAYVSAYRKYFDVYTHDRDGNWGGHRVDHLKLLDDVKKKVRENFERKRKGAT